MHFRAKDGAHATTKREKGTTAEWSKDTEVLRRRDQLKISSKMGIFV
jgi:hypothetical protein